MEPVEFEQFKRQVLSTVAASGAAAGVEFCEQCFASPSADLNRFQRSWVAQRICLLSDDSIAAFERLESFILDPDSLLRNRYRCAEKLKASSPDRAREFVLKAIAGLGRVQHCSAADVLEALARTAAELDVPITADTRETTISPSVARIDHSQIAINAKLEGYAPPALREMSGTRIDAPGVDIFDLRNVRLVSFKGFLVLLDAEGRRIGNASDRIPLAIDEFDKIVRSKAMPIQGTCCLMADRFMGGTYGHWLLDWLPRLLLAKEVAPSIDVGLIRTFRADFQTSAVSAIAPEMALFPMDGNAVYDLERVIVCSSSFAACGFRHPMQAGNKALASRLTRFADGYRESRKRRLFIPRRTTRPLLNESDVWARLEPLGFEKVDPGLCSFDDQVRMFASAEMIVGNHGAAMANLIFAPKGAQILSVFSPTDRSAAYAIVAAAADLEFCGFGEPPRGDINERVKLYGSRLDLAFLDRWLERASAKASMPV